MAASEISPAESEKWWMGWTFGGLAAIAVTADHGWAMHMLGWFISAMSAATIMRFYRSRRRSALAPNSPGDETGTDDGEHS